MRIFFLASQAAMYGWWLEAEHGTPSVLPVRAVPSSPSGAALEVKVTSYVLPNAQGALIALAAFAALPSASASSSSKRGAAGAALSVSLAFNFPLLGGLPSDPSQLVLSAPQIIPFQLSGQNNIPLTNVFSVPEQGGVVLLLHKK